ncbi:transposase family protein [Micromonospora sp. WMMA1949]|uniref:transposase family protein n=1 Tax=Micromonospora sp. WMMA1949 TaxID=3015162 RepID=UPI0022B6E641|nr:transposase family protein [Micromonospora sp. WMMA1949]MCZ7424121.1 transposase family protein [Micromonospora sp. WMMA1949]
MTPTKTSPADGLISHPALAVAAPTYTAEATPVTDREHSELLRALAAVPDPRDPRGVRYPLTPLLAVAVCAVMGGRRRLPRSPISCTTSTTKPSNGSGSPQECRSRALSGGS